MSYFRIIAATGFLALSAGAGPLYIVPNDFNGDKRSDLVGYDDTTGSWRIQYSDALQGFNTSNVARVTFGFAGTIPMPGDFDGDGFSDFALFDPSSGTWYFRKSTAGNSTVSFGYRGAVPVTGDFDGDGRTDIGCYEPGTGLWSLQQSTAGFRSVTWGYAGTVPVTGDFDGDGRTDIGCYSPLSGAWNILRSTAGAWSTTFGGDQTGPTTFDVSPAMPIWGRFDGDAKDDVAFLRHLSDGATTLFSVRQSTGGDVNTTLPLQIFNRKYNTGDFDGDGRTDLLLDVRNFILAGQSNVTFAGDFANDYRTYTYPTVAPGPLSVFGGWFSASDLVPLRTPVLNVQRQDGRRFTITRGGTGVPSYLGTLRESNGASAPALLGALGRESYLMSTGLPSTGPITISARGGQPGLVPVGRLYFVVDSFSGSFLDATGTRGVTVTQKFLAVPIF